MPRLHRKFQSQPYSWWKMIIRLSSASVVLSDFKIWRYFFITGFKLLKLSFYRMSEIFNCFGDIYQHLIQLLLKFSNLCVYNVIVHFSPGLFIDQIIMDICFFGKTTHIKAHFLLVNILSNIHNERSDVMAAILFFEETTGTR